MKATQIQIGHSYEITCGKDKTMTVKVLDFKAKTASWECETYSGKTIPVKDSKRFVKEINQRAAGPQPVPVRLAPSHSKLSAPAGHLLLHNTIEQRELDDALDTKASTAVKRQASEHRKGGKPKGSMSGLDAAHRVLTESGKAMNAREITEAAIAGGYCILPGATPHATISAAIQRELNKKGTASRFIRAGKGLFAAR